MRFPGMKQEPDDERVPSDPPSGGRRPGHGRVSPSSSEVKQEPEAESFSFQLPFRPASSSSKSNSKEPGEINSSPNRPTFPRALNETPTRAPSAQSAESPRLSNRYLQTGPIPKQDTPQERFRRAMMGFGRLNAKPKKAASPTSNGGAPIPVGPIPVGPIPVGPIPVGPRALQPDAGGFRGFIPTGPNTYALGDKSTTSDFHRVYADQPNVLQRLSRECQSRHFNPQWDERQTHTGTFTCNVKLGNHWIIGDEQFGSAVAAKLAAAKKALKVIRTKGFNATMGVANQQGGSNIVSMPRQNGQHAMSGRLQSAPAPKLEEDTTMTGTGGSESTALAVTRQSRGAERAHENSEHDALLDHVRRVAGVSLPDAAIGNPDIARAFLEGLAVGARLTKPAPSRPRHSRSRSPLALRLPSSGYRERSSSVHQHASASYRERSSPRNRNGPSSSPRSQRHPRRNLDSADRYYRPKYPSVTEDTFGRLN